MGGCKSISIVSILILSSFFGIFALYGTDVAVGTPVSGHISVDTTWDLTGSPYIVMNDVVVDPGVTLTISPGVEVKFDPPGTHDFLNIYVEGIMISVGQSDMPINFTSNAANPGSDWGRVQINSTGIAQIENCSFTYGKGVIVASAVSHNISHNTFFHIAKLKVRTPSHNITNNRLGNSSAISLESEDNVATNNSLSGATIWLSAGRNVVSNNTLQNGYIIVDMFSSSNVIVNNSLRDMGGTGIDLRSSYNVIFSNSIASCDIGIEVRSGEANNIISHNEITNCRYGIYLLASHDNKVLRNRVTGGSNGIWSNAGYQNLIVGNEVSFASSHGIWLRSASGDIVYHNNIYENAIQAEDTGNSNSWDNGYPSGGNYWSDYSGNDSFWGRKQDIPGSDGVGDTPYLVNPNGTDRYPLTELTIGNLPPRNVNAYLTGTNFENVTITWNLSWNDGKRANDVTGYEIYRSSTYNKKGIGYSLIGSTPNQTTEFVDSYSGEADPNNYFYYICAVNGTGNRSCSENQVAKFTQQLSEGPNLVSIPLAQSDEGITTVLQTVSFENVWSYDSQSKEWISFSKAKPYSKGLEYVNNTIGIWINVTAESNLTIAGKVMTETSISLAPGWNLVGYPSFLPISLADVKQESPILKAEKYKPGTSPYYLTVMNENDLFKPGEGYWLYCSVEWVITLKN